MILLFYIRIKGEGTNIADVYTLNDKIRVSIMNPLLWLVPEGTPVFTLYKNNLGIENVGDILRYVDNKFDDGFRPLGHRTISSHDKCIKCEKPFSEHTSNNRFCPK